MAPLFLWGYADTVGHIKKEPGMGKKDPRGAYSDRPVYGKRPERNPSSRALYEANKKIILATQSICGICGKPVDKTLKYPDPMSASVDHIIPVSKHGDPISLDNLQLAHRYCNRMKSDKLPEITKKESAEEHCLLPQSANWRNF